MCKKQFWANPYQTEHLTRVSWVEGSQVELEETIFYAESGGQESDSGTIAGIAVTKAEKQGRTIRYTLDQDAAFGVGEEVWVQIDWPRRYQLMKLHFAAEVVLELFYQKFSEVEKIGAHISQDKSRIDFYWSESIAPLLPELTEQANKIIAQDSPIISAFSDETEERRYWQVEGFAKVPCGGTHLKRTGEVGAIRLKRKNIGGGKERVEIYLA
ncbi:alanyl-tRNA editing protein [Vibrio fluvialis]|nr:alanyl-tRNA editing protein [Vibrio fluvialis]MBY7952767.1 alanyl-tRNA editing protein [Vibrio fluvialis]MBY8064074.1 alanyl-tRNA editing protein [Vibrio fluvialis]MBY8091963.1 alanyl-tRNA editing protein [Vibrio fluvialis]MBY8132652.1 alanyl-tRNA editing protein [Vibrio fluvialis]